MIISPLRNNVLIEIVKEKKTSFGLIIPELTTEKACRGFVKAVGQGYYDHKFDKVNMSTLKIGDYVVFNKLDSIEFIEDGVNYVLVSEDNIYGVIL